MALVATLGLSVAACGGGSSDSNAGNHYPAKTRATFVASCMTNGGDSASCGCTYAKIEAKLPYEKFVLAEGLMRQSGSLVSLPSKMQDIFASAIADCG